MTFSSFVSVLYIIFCLSFTSEVSSFPFVYFFLLPLYFSTPLRVRSVRTSLFSDLLYLQFFLTVFHIYYYSDFIFYLTFIYSLLQFSSSNLHLLSVSLLFTLFFPLPIFHVLSYYFHLLSCSTFHNFSSLPSLYSFYRSYCLFFIHDLSYTYLSIHLSLIFALSTHYFNSSSHYLIYTFHSSYLSSSVHSSVFFLASSPASPRLTLSLLLLRSPSLPPFPLGLKLDFS